MIFHWNLLAPLFWNRLLKHSTVWGNLALPMLHCCPVPTLVSTGMVLSCSDFFRSSHQRIKQVDHVQHSTVQYKQSSTTLLEQIGNNLWSCSFYPQASSCVSKMCKYTGRILTYLIHTAQSLLCLESRHSTMRSTAVCWEAFFCFIFHCSSHLAPV